MQRATFLLLAAVVSASAFVETVPELDVDKFLGRWYQVYSDTTHEQVSGQQHAGVCRTVDYGPSVSPHSLSVHHAERLGGPGGPVRSRDGVAVMTDASQPGKLRAVMEGAMSAGDHWVLALGPETYRSEGGEEQQGPGLYEWAVLSDRDRVGLSVLSRDVQRFEQDYGPEVLSLLESLGFDDVEAGRAVRVAHDEGCGGYEGHDRVGLARLAGGEEDGEEDEEGWPRRIKTVDEIDLSAYTGRWFQVYSNALVANTFERNGFCVTADYELIEQGTAISVHNAQNMGSPTGAISTIEGRAFAPDPSKPAQLTVVFDQVPFPGSYWVIDLGPVVGGQYQYSVVTDNFAQTLFILARDVSEFRQRYEKRVLSRVEKLFSGPLHKPLETVQGEGCAYSQPPSEPQQQLSVVQQQAAEQARRHLRRA